MIRRVLGVCAAFSVAVTVWAAAPVKPAAPSGPRLAVEPPTFDFGQVKQQAVLKKDFQVRNFGDADLVLQDPTSSCGCTAAQFESKVVKPGAAVPLKVELRTASALGRIVKKVYLKSNDSSQEIFEVQLIATVVAGK
jgi:hypothetical protein